MDQAVSWYRAAAEHGNTTAQCNLASLYMVGREVPRNYYEAARWFRAAAERGFAVAQNNLAFMYYNGMGVPRDYGQAAGWTQRAAEQGYVIAKSDLGYLYEQGKGVPLDYVTAYMWYSLGAAGGDSRASREMKDLSKRMSPKQMVEARNRASTAAQQFGQIADYPGIEVSGASFVPPH